jgi:hypothetical protein
MQRVPCPTLLVFTRVEQAATVPAILVDVAGLGEHGEVALD